MLTGTDTKIDESIKEAFAMAQAGVDALETGFTIWSTPGQFAANVVPARHPKVQRLIENVFAHQDIIDDRVPLPQRNVEYNYKMNMNNLKLYKVYRMSSLSRHNIKLMFYRSVKRNSFNAAENQQCRK
jgi:hypothetical protein